MVREIHCRECWQLVSLYTGRCPRCGDIDPIRFRKAIVELALGAIALAGGCGIVLLVVFDQCT
jgi:hypothetical protein